MANFAYSDNSLYSQVVNELGARGLSSEKMSAVQNAIQESLGILHHVRPWSWRRARTDLTVTAATPYAFLPNDCDTVASREIAREESQNSEVVTLVDRTDRDFWRMNAGADPGAPQYFRVVWREVGSSAGLCMETVPPTDGTRTYPDVEYWRSVQTLTFAAGTPVTPTMPPEFHGTWKALALAKAAVALGRWRQGQTLRADAERELNRAIERYDQVIADVPAVGVEDVYGDWERHL